MRGTVPQFFRSPALFALKVLSLSPKPPTVVMSCWATIRWCTLSLASFSILIAPSNDVKLGVRHTAALLRHTATLAGPKTDSEADLTISPEFLKPTKSVWSEILACLAHKIMAELEIGTLPASVRKGARMGAEENGGEWLKWSLARVLKRAPVGVQVVAGAVLKMRWRGC